MVTDINVLCIVSVTCVLDVCTFLCSAKIGVIDMEWYGIIRLARLVCYWYC